MKKEFICVKPKCTVAKDRFLSDMRELHSCRVNSSAGGQGAVGCEDMVAGAHAAYGHAGEPRRGRA